MEKKIAQMISENKVTSSAFIYTLLQECIISKLRLLEALPYIKINMDYIHCS